MSHGPSSLQGHYKSYVENIHIHMVICIYTYKGSYRNRTGSLSRGYSAVYKEFLTLAHMSYSEYYGL